MVSNHVQQGNYSRTPVDEEDAKTILTPGEGNIKDLIQIVLHEEVMSENLERLTFHSSTRPSPVPGRQRARRGREG